MPMIIYHERPMHFTLWENQLQFGGIGVLCYVIVIALCSTV